MSAEDSARSIRQADGQDPVRALQRVLYRSAKQDPHRRFHALFDKVARSDVMWRAWVDVTRNQGAPGVDKVSIADVEAGGVQQVRAFLDGLAQSLRGGIYRPQPLRRVRIPKAGQPGKSRPLGIPTVVDRVVMTAAKVGPRADLRGRLLPGELRVPAQALGPHGPGGHPGRGQPGGDVGARR